MSIKTQRSRQALIGAKQSFNPAGQAAQITTAALNIAPH